MAGEAKPTREAAEILTRERCHIRELVNDPAIAAFSLAEARVESGITTELHTLDVDEWYVIRRGTGLMTVGDRDPFPVAPGDVVAIPAGTPQQIGNTAAGDLVFTCICLPRFTPDSYQSLEDD